nr:MAG TPA: hypothetical protein [Caudoviricetes sp.]
MDRQGYRFYPSHRGISLITNSDHLTKYVLSNLHELSLSTTPPILGCY